MLHGYWQDQITYKDGKVEIGPTFKNKITKRGAVLLASLIGGFDQGISYCAFGSGDPAWDLSPVAPLRTETQLLNEVYRTLPSSIVFIKYGIGTALSGDNFNIFDPRRVVDEELVGRIEDDDFFVGQTINITGGTNVGESRTIVDFVEATGQITVDAAYPDPIDDTSTYEIVPVIVSERTNSIEIRAEIPPGEAGDSFNNVDYREFGIFGSDLATEDPDTGLLLDKLHFPVRNKIEDFTFTKFVRLTMIT